MNRLLSVSAFLVTSTVLTQPAIAQVGPEAFTPIVTGSGGGGDNSETRGYLGLSWSFGANGSSTPKVVVGVQAIDVDPSGDLTGVDLNASFDLQTGLDRIAFSGLTGTNDLYANLGAGYDFGLGQPFVTGALQGTRLRIGLDYAWLSQTYTPYIEVNSLDKPDAGSGGTSTLSCAISGYVPVTRDQLLDPQDQSSFDGLVALDLDVDGRLCLPEGDL